MEVARALDRSGHLSVHVIYTKGMGRGEEANHIISTSEPHSRYFLILPVCNTSPNPCVYSLLNGQIWEIMAVLTKSGNVNILIF